MENKIQFNAHIANKPIDEIPIQIKIHNTNERLPIAGETLLVADEYMGMVGWKMILVQKVLYTQGITKKKESTDGRITIRTRLLEFTEPKKGRKTVVYYQQAGHNEITTATESFRYVVLADDLLELIYNKPIIRLCDLLTH
jgi:hypothetical protein